MTYNADAGQFQRTEMLLGHDALERLKALRVAVFGLGGVGGHAAEALARSGVGALDLIDGDCVTLSNINRQIIALHSTVGRPKVEVMAARLQDINPAVRLRTYEMYFSAEHEDELPFDEYDYIVDAVDMVSAKLALAVIAEERGIPIISAMGAGDKLDPMRFKVADIYETRVCPLARVMRRELRRLGVTSLRVVYSDEPPVRDLSDSVTAASISDNADAGSIGTREDESTEAVDMARGRHSGAPGSTAFVPAAAGLLMAAELVRDVTGRRE